MPLKIGLTGGIGAGKSIVAKIFQTLGVAVFNADNVSKVIMVEDSGVRKQVISVFGDKAYKGNELNRKFLADRVFSNEGLRQELNAIVHPAVGRAFEHWVEKYSNDAYVIKEAAITLETGIHGKLDSVILVIAPEKVRIDRVMKRDNVSENMVRDRMAAQWTDENKIPLSDYIIVNDGCKPLIPQVLEIHNKLNNSIAK